MSEQNDATAEPTEPTEPTAPTVDIPTVDHGIEDEALGRAAYAAYGDVTGGLNFQGDSMPDYDELSPKIQAAWRAAACRAAAVSAERAASTPQSRTWV